MKPKLNALIAFLIAAFLLAGCIPLAPTPVPTPTLAPVPTPRVGYQVSTSTKNTWMIVISPADATDRDGLLYLSRWLCRDQWDCWIWYWDDPAKADTAYPLDPEHEKDLVAFFRKDAMQATDELKIYILGDQ